jgi:SAM-dependent methyltransferase
LASHTTELGSEPYSADNLLDRLSSPASLEYNYEYLFARERTLLDQSLGLTSGDVLSVGCGWNPGRHLFPAPAFHLVGVDADPALVWALPSTGRVDRALAGYAGHLDLQPASFDVVLYRLALHHIVFREPLDACFKEAARLLRPGGALVVIEPGLWHPVGLGLAAANRVGLGVRLHGTPDDVPLSPRELLSQARRAGLSTRLYAVTYSWRRLPVGVQRMLRSVDGALGSRPRSARFGHTLLMVGKKP